MSNKKARLITTLDCNRRCNYCCNTKEIIDKAIEIEYLEVLKDYEEISITGGEPLIDINNTYRIVHILRLGGFSGIINLYTSLSFHDLLLTQTSWWRFFYPINRVTYTVHPNDISNMLDYKKFELVLRSPNHLYNRLKIHKNIKDRVFFDREIWDEIIYWEDTIDCGVPSDEDLYIMKGVR